MNYNELKNNLHEYLKDNFSDAVESVYDYEDSKNILKEETKKYLVNTKQTDNLKQTVSMLFNDLFGLGILEEIMQDETITDISYNGKSLWVQSNVYGRKLYKRQISPSEAYIIIEKIAMQAKKQFNVANPILDVEYETIRLNAIHESLSPDGRSFSIRLLKLENKINEFNFPATKEVEQFLIEAVQNRKNIIISGQTGSGKSELQKYLIKFTNDNEKIVLISDNNELKLSKLYPQKDIYTWITSTSEFSPINIGFTKLIKPALRYNPEWLIISETRGAEAFDMINAATTGHNIITTLHASSAHEIPTRLLSMSTEKNINLNENTILKNIYSVLNIGVQLETKFNDDKTIKRQISEIVIYNKDMSITKIYDVKRGVLLNENN